MMIMMIIKVMVIKMMIPHDNQSDLVHPLTLQLRTRTIKINGGYFDVDYIST